MIFSEATSRPLPMHPESDIPLPGMSGGCVYCAVPGAQARVRAPGLPRQFVEKANFRVRAFRTFENDNGRNRASFKMDGSPSHEYVASLIDLMITWDAGNSRPASTDPILQPLLRYADAYLARVHEDSFDGACGGDSAQCLGEDSRRGDDLCRAVEVFMSNLDSHQLQLLRSEFNRKRAGLDAAAATVMPRFFVRAGDLLRHVVTIALDAIQQCLDIQTATVIAGQLQRLTAAARGAAMAPAVSLALPHAPWLAPSAPQSYQRLSPAAGYSVSVLAGMANSVVLLKSECESTAQFDDRTRSDAVDMVLVALTALAGNSDAAILTGVLNQCLATPMFCVFHESGDASPLRLPDGRPVIPGSGGRVHADLIRMVDGAYRLDVLITCRRLAVVSCKGADGEMLPVSLDPHGSRLSMRYSINVLPGMKAIDYVKGSASFRYRFVPAAESASSASA